MSNLEFYFDFKPNIKSIEIEQFNFSDVKMI